MTVFIVVFPLGNRGGKRGREEGEEDEKRATFFSTSSAVFSFL